MKQKANAFKVNMLKSGCFLGCLEIPKKEKENVSGIVARLIYVQAI